VSAAQRAAEVPVADSQSPFAHVESRIGRAIATLYQVLDRNRLTRFPWAVVQTFSQAQGALLSGSMAYYTFLSLLPLLMVAVFIIGTLSEWNVGIQTALVRVANEIAPGVQGADVLGQVIRSRVAFGIFGFVSLTYAGSGFVGALTACLNRMWQLQSGRNPIGQKVLNLLIVILLGVVLLGSVGLTFWVAYLTRAALGSGADPVVAWLDRLATPMSFGFVLLLLYQLLPARRLSWASQLPGAVFGAVAIEVLKRLFQFWAERSTGVAVLPRSLLSVVLLLIWFGFFGQAILYGAAINVVLERRRRGRPLLPPGVQPTSAPDGRVRPPAAHEPAKGDWPGARR
jgi:membrane protein